VNITDKMIDYISGLTKLHIPIEEREKTKEELGSIIGYMNILDELDTSNMEVMSHTFPIKNVFREDVVNISAQQKDILQNAPNQKNGYFQVPKTVE